MRNSIENMFKFLKRPERPECIAFNKTSIRSIVSRESMLWVSMTSHFKNTGKRNWPFYTDMQQNIEKWFLRFANIRNYL